jgi:adenosylcobyric acid synthase
VPFKAQNMSNNARVVPGGEIGVAQWLQALAARVPPTVAMNPVLLKPEADTQSQVVVNGTVRHDLTAMPWRDRGEHLWPAMTGAFDSLRAAHELVLIEGAGSPAEINLQDLVNNGMMEYADAAGLLVVDIDRRRLLCPPLRHLVPHPGVDS